LITDQDGATTLQTENYWQQKLFMFHLIMTHPFSTISIRMKLFSKQVLQMVNPEIWRKSSSKGFFFGDFDAMFNKLHGKELSYNNLLM
jgi:phosphoribosylaminoimidazolecarboxamide formyltransferase/IMP cyclohydrolase